MHYHVHAILLYFLRCICHVQHCGKDNMFFCSTRVWPKTETSFTKLADIIDPAKGYFQNESTIVKVPKAWIAILCTVVRYRKYRVTVNTPFRGEDCYLCLLYIIFVSATLWWIDRISRRAQFAQLEEWLQAVLLLDAWRRYSFRHSSAVKGFMENTSLLERVRWEECMQSGHRGSEGAIWYKE